MFETLSENRRWLYVVAAILVAIIALFILFRFMTSGILTITTNKDGATISIIDESGKEKANKKTNKLKKRLTPGNYAVYVKLGDNQATKTAKVSARKNSEISIELPEPKVASDIVDSPASKVIALKNGVVYLNPQTQHTQIYTYGNVSPVAFIPSVTKITDITLNDTGFGLAKTSKNEIFEINNGKSLNITNKIFGKLVGDFKIAIGSKNNTYAVSTGKNIFVKRQDQQIQLTTQSKNEDTNLAYDGENNLAVFSTPLGYPFGDTHKDEYINAVNPYGYKGSGIEVKNLLHNTSKTLDGDRIVVSAAWSPNGKFLAYALDSFIKIYDAEKESIIESIGKRKIDKVQLSWCSDSQLSFNDNTGVWIYDSSKRQTNILSKKSNIRSVSCSGTELYFGVQETVTEGGVYKVFLGNNEMGEIINKLNGALPHETDHYKITYTGLESPPVVTIQTYAPRNPGLAGRADPTFERRTSKYKQEALEYLRSKGIDTSKVRINFVVFQ